MKRRFFFSSPARALDGPRRCSISFLPPEIIYRHVHYPFFLRGIMNIPKCVSSLCRISARAMRSFRVPDGRAAALQPNSAHVKAYRRAYSKRRKNSAAQNVKATYGAPAEIKGGLLAAKRDPSPVMNGDGRTNGGGIRQMNGAAPTSMAPGGLNGGPSRHSAGP